MTKLSPYGRYGLNSLLVTFCFKEVAVVFGTGALKTKLKANTEGLVIHELDYQRVSQTANNLTDIPVLLFN